MRVATRRQRAAWRVFGASFRPGRTKRYRTGLREIASRLGTVRDLDVLLEAADIYRADMPVAEQRALEPLLRDWHEHRDDARVLLVRELNSDGYRRWVDDYRDFVRTDGAAVMPVLPTQPHRVRDTAGSRIWTAYEQVRGYEPVLRWADVETLHELRIAGKWLRYTLEFVREALGDDAAPLIARVTALQDHLGLMTCRCLGIDGTDLPHRARRRPVGARERRDRAVPREPGARGGSPPPHHRRAVAGCGRRHVPTLARPRGRAPLSSSPADDDSGRDDGEQMPGVRDPLELVLAAILEAEP